ncbi:hypothetical protein pEaSNUABM44_00307 [Erwinia phage pEa_SNUABM_44]|nr:hypothetical protein pEaSNUABM44_00307 [Erwinia phage pEa_SNUABM_44]
MIIFIYNIVSIIFSLMFIYTGHIVEVKIFYVMLALCAIGITFCVNKVVESYKTIHNSEKKEAIEMVYVHEYGLRLSNYIGSFIVHSSIILMLIHSIPLFVSISAVLIYRVLSLIKNNKLVIKERKSK